MTIAQGVFGAAAGMLAGSGIFSALQTQSRKRQLIGTAAFSSAVVAALRSSPFTMGLKLGVLTSTSILIATSYAQSPQSQPTATKTDQVFIKKEQS